MLLCALPGAFPVCDPERDCWCLPENVYLIVPLCVIRLPFTCPFASAPPYTSSGVFPRVLFEKYSHVLSQPFSCAFTSVFPHVFPGTFLGVYLPRFLLFLLRVLHSVVCFIPHSFFLRFVRSFVHSSKVTSSLCSLVRFLVLTAYLVRLILHFLVSSSMRSLVRIPDEILATFLSAFPCTVSPVPGHSFPHPIQRLNSGV